MSLSGEKQLKTPIRSQRLNLLGYFAAMVLAVYLGGCADSPKLAASGESSAARVSQLLVKAYGHMVRNEDAEAEHALLDVRRLEPGNPWVALDLGVIYQRRGQVEMARAEYRKVLASPTRDRTSASVSGAPLNGASLQKIALYNLETLGKAGGTGHMAEAPTHLDRPRQITSYRQSEIHAETDPEADTKSLRRAVETWRRAWENRDIIAYLNCYQRDFRGAKPDRKAWEAYRRKQINGAAGQIDLQIQDVRISVRGDDALVRFKQHYRADNYADSGIKEFGLVRVDGNWLINKELFEAFVK